MPALNEQTLDNWRKPPSENEEQMISNAISMIKNAIDANELLKKKDIEIVIQGSYANNTNVKLDSDIDVTIMLRETFYRIFREGATDKDYGFSDGTNSFNDYKSSVIKAVLDKFGSENVTIGNKSIKIKSNSYHVKADVVPAFQYRNYLNDRNNNPDNYIEGIKFFSSEGLEIINYPKVHVANGISKNNKTQRKFKRTVRLYKRIRNKMIDDGLNISSNISSFLLESLLWNVPNEMYTNEITWNGILRSTIIYLYNSTKTEEGCKDWGEVSEYFYLFHNGRKWNRVETNNFLVQMWNYLEYQS